MVGNINTKKPNESKYWKKNEERKEDSLKRCRLVNVRLFLIDPIVESTIDLYRLEENETKNKQSLQRPLLTYRYREMKIEREPVFVVVDLWEWERWVVEWRSARSWRQRTVKLESTPWQNTNAEIEALELRVETTKVSCFNVWSLCFNFYYGEGMVY